MVECSAGTVVFVCSTVFISAILRGITGFGFALAAVPLISLVMPPVQGVAIAILLQCMIGLSDLVSVRGLIDRSTLAMMSVGAMVGTPAGLMTLRLLSPDALRVIIAVIVLAGLAGMIGKVRLRSGPRQAAGAGLLAGLFSGLAAMPGPPAVAYVVGTATPALQARATLMVFFFVTSLIALPGLLVQRIVGLPTVLVAAASLPLLVIGTRLGGRVFGRLDDAGYQKAAIATLAATALASASRSVWGLLNA
ncbi:sulfite exporter TauE/SafE family protein [Paracoccus sp. KCTC 42845]|uniref:Probable membrane transporter protein n=2 Tax=Paracoccus aerius TaxID=1915382 RepID=A0ABS1SA97_9RHOB|nr:sulfite exporter TauE/SafE family protein [Paracoccus aerius]GHG35821.1 membrane protein [Paracoccus aerius]